MQYPRSYCDAVTVLNGVTIRDAETRDVTAMHAVEHAAFDDGWSFGLLRQVLSLFAGLTLVAEVDGEVCGHAITAIVDSDPRTGWIINLGVHPNRQRTGIGQALTAAAVDRLHERGVQRVFLSVAPDNSTAIGVYRRAGFEDHGYEPDYFGPGQPRIIMVARTPRTPGFDRPESGVR